MLGKLIEQSEAGKCLVIGTIMADRLIIKQQKISVYRRNKYQVVGMKRRGTDDNIIFTKDYIKIRIFSTMMYQRGKILRN